MSEEKDTEEKIKKLSCTVNSLTCVSYILFVVVVIVACIIFLCEKHADTAEKLVIPISIMLTTTFMLAIIFLWVKKEILPEELNCLKNMEVARLQNESKLNDLKKSIDLILAKLDNMK